MALCNRPPRLLYSTWPIQKDLSVQSEAQRPKPDFFPISRGCQLSQVNIETIPPKVLISQST